LQVWRMSLPVFKAGDAAIGAPNTAYGHSMLCPYSVRRTSGELEAIEIHHLVPCRHEVSQKLRL
jgi:hypothetical protein